MGARKVATRISDSTGLFHENIKTFHEPHHKAALNSTLGTCMAMSSSLPNHSRILPTNPSISPVVLPACRHNRTLCVPSGTVGGTMGRTTKPPSWQYFARLRGSGVKSANIGDWGFCRGMSRAFSRTPLYLRVGITRDSSCR
jgi:hypothetical protein